jgi:hypothetical protein
MANTLGKSGKIFPARVFSALPSVVARGARQRIFLKKIIKNRLCRRPLPGALSTGFFSKKIEKQHLPGALGTGFFFKKIEKPSLPTAFARGARHKLFF